MKKMKTNRGARKRLKLTGSGRVKYRHANRNHILTKKSNKRKLHLRATDELSPSDVNEAKRLIGVK
ncbi:MAG TPA: 50S ribosomal protein L35 [Coxiellaceae bacterium]|nr:50S ribosomal protein L35 [Coxiellaceae bacterium]